MWYSQEEIIIYKGQLEATLKELQDLRNMQKDAIADYKVRSRVAGNEIELEYTLLVTLVIWVERCLYIYLSIHWTIEIWAIELKMDTIG